MKVPADVSEAKQFAIAIYNICVVGGIGYFLSVYLSASNVDIGNLLRALGIMLSSTVAVLIIMVPKLFEANTFQC